MQQQLQTYILKRFLTETELESLVEDYNDARIVATGERDVSVTPMQYEWLNLHQNGLRYSEIAKQFGCKYEKVRIGVLKAALAKIERS